MHKQVSGWTVNFGPNSPVYPFLELKTRIPPPPLQKTSDLGWPKFTPEYPPHFRKLQIWDDQSLLQNTPPFWKTSDLGWPKFTPEYPPPPNFGKLHIWDDQSLLRNTPPLWKTSDLGWPKFTLEYPPPHFRKLQIWDDQSLLRNTPHFGKLQIWDDQSLLRNTPPTFWKTSDLGWPKFTPEYPPISENFRFGMTKVYSGIPPPPNENCQRVQVRDFQNTESYYMWRLYPTWITTSYITVQKIGIYNVLVWI